MNVLYPVILAFRAVPCIWGTGCRKLAAKVLLFDYIKVCARTLFIHKMKSRQCIMIAKLALQYDDIDPLSNEKAEDLPPDGKQFACLYLLA